MKPVFIDSSIIETKRGDWYVAVNYRNNDKRQRIHVYNGRDKFQFPKPEKFKSKADKRTYYHNLQKVIENYYKDAPSMFELDAAVEMTLEIAAKRRKTTKSFDAIKLPVTRFNKFLGNVPLDQVKKSDIHRFLQTINGSPRNINLHKGSLFWMFERLCESGYLADNPVVGIKKMKENPKRNLAYTDEELQLVLSYCKAYSPHLHLAACLMYSAFLRPGECINLKRYMIDLNRNMISIPSSIRKTNFNFDIPITTKINTLLKERNIDALNRNEYVFYDTNPEKPLEISYFKKAFYRVKKRMLEKNLILEDHTMYSIRHTSAIKYFTKTNNLDQLRKLMGHQDLKTTLIYLRSLGLYNNDINADDIPDF
jgi:integrase